uniref:Secreted protein n=1 Tax=Panagrellus redivivus TaxID=6233 RepID=A0A7E4VWM0_PANRE
MASITVLFVILHLSVYRLADATICNNAFTAFVEPYLDCARKHRIMPSAFDPKACNIEKDIKTGKVTYSCLDGYSKNRKRNECVKDKYVYYYVCETDNCNTRSVCNDWFKYEGDNTNPVPAPAPAPAPAPGAAAPAPNASAPTPSPKSTGTRCHGPTLAILVLLFGVYFTV